MGCMGGKSGRETPISDGKRERGQPGQKKVPSHDGPVPVRHPNSDDGRGQEHAGGERRERELGVPQDAVIHMESKSAHHDAFHDRKNRHVVAMPCSPHFVTSHGEPIWPIICRELSSLQNMCSQGGATFVHLSTTIEKCAWQRYDMRGLEELINKVYSKNERAHFMSEILPGICQLALDVGDVCGQSPPLLPADSNRTVTMSQKQAASLLACAFFCLFPDRATGRHGGKHGGYPDPNFHRLYQAGPPNKLEKLKCILHYFDRVIREPHNGIITFQRYALPKSAYPQWAKSHQPIAQLELSVDKKIEDIDDAMQVDFANKFIGGGVLGTGCVQEEIRFAICPEMLVSLLLCEMMGDNECIFLMGCERYSSYKGYASSFEFDGPYHDRTPDDPQGHKRSYLVAMDALYYRDPSTQFHMEQIDRELIKAYTSFSPNIPGGTSGPLKIATGNWGCGAFNGDRELKAIIQLLAASQANRKLFYAAYGDARLFKAFNEIYRYLTDEGATAADLYQYLRSYTCKSRGKSLFEYIRGLPVGTIRLQLPGVQPPLNDLANKASMERSTPDDSTQL